MRASRATCVTSLGGIGSYRGALQLALQARRGIRPRWPSPAESTSRVVSSPPPAAAHLKGILRSHFSDLKGLPHVARLKAVVRNVDDVDHRRVYHRLRLRKPDEREVRFAAEPGQHH